MRARSEGRPLARPPIWNRGFHIDAPAGRRHPGPPATVLWFTQLTIRRKRRKVGMKANRTRRNRRQLAADSSLLEAKANARRTALFAPASTFIEGHSM
jgi:hypothetical protein